MQWSKHDYGPGTDVCCRCLKAKEPSRRASKWCRKCDAAMRGKQVQGGGRQP